MSGNEIAVGEAGRRRGAAGRDLPLARPRRSRPVRQIVGATILLPAVAFVVVLTLALVYSAVMPPSTLMLGRWLTLQPVSRDAVSLSEIAPALPQAVIASEDQRFCLDHGVDLGAIREVVEDEDSPSRGASAIAMQTVKNVFLWPGRSYIRKAVEIPLALALDTLWGKRRMMEIYLNVAEWGDGIYGAQAASRHWFNKDASRLTRGEAALLAAVLPNPITRSAGRPSPGVRRRAAQIQAMMGQIEGLTGCVRR
ncbi:monofunctional biosynthetic peptidoglycan transglycosylase [Methylobacterium tardum]|uniref:monofunctional biosynthetic peptidoglycan transglycosylase n=1 Tax=Methylobacterium tardum TaxID=374432 RepID=UPI003D3514A8